ncbi:hemolysin activation/secretion protein [Povalibacter uvarum]|uniref:Hemolysin activation/secretion protein n=1 Tax=Povalibacter uvarum TaxID=732238 RepID=A0A841HMG2_9GAMM|nr:hemolysin activation/secretion protein [Povalibacter uvarum]
MTTLVIMACALWTHSSHAENPALSAAVIDGVTAYSPAALFPVYREQLGQPISSESARNIIAEIEAMYMRDGYSRPEFRLQNDLIGSGVLQIEVFEARLSGIEVEGNAGPYVRTIEQLVDELRSRVPLRSDQLQRALQRMRELPGLEFRASMRRDKERPNTFALVIDAQYKPLEATVQLTNRGTRQIGPEFALAQLTANNLLGRNERLGLFASSATDYEEYHGGGLFMDLPIGEQGTHLTGSTFASRSNPHEQPDRPDVYDRDRTSMRVNHPLSSTQRRTLTVSGGFDVDNLEITREGEWLRDEQLRVLEIGGRSSTRSSATTQRLLSMQFRQGLDAFGSHLEARNPQTDQRRLDFLLMRMQYTQLTRFADQWTVRVDALGQQSAYVLPDTERYKIGGERLGRGFEVTEIAGDQGIGAKLELRRDLTGPSAAIGKTSLYGFYDFGAAWKQDQSGRESAATTGLGFALEWGRVAGYLEVAKPLTHTDVEGERETKVFAEVSLRL